MRMFSAKMGGATYSTNQRRAQSELRDVLHFYLHSQWLIVVTLHVKTLHELESIICTLSFCNKCNHFGEHAHLHHKVNNIYNKYHHHNDVKCHTEKMQ